MVLEERPKNQGWKSSGGNLKTVRGREGWGGLGRAEAVARSSPDPSDFLPWLPNVVRGEAALSGLADQAGTLVSVSSGLRLEEGGRQG